MSMDANRMKSCGFNRKTNEKKKQQPKKNKTVFHVSKLSITDSLSSSASEPQQTCSPEQEEGVIPDSPILPSTLPMANKLKRRKNNNKAKHVRYEETPLPQSHSSLFNELNKETLETSQHHGKADVLVPETCEMDTSHTSKDMNHNLEEMVAETCGFEIPDNPRTEIIGLQSSSKSPKKSQVGLRPYRSSSSAPPSASSSTVIHCLDSTMDRSPSLLPRLKRGSDDSCLHKAKRKKEEADQDVQEEDKQGGVEKQKEGQQIKRPSNPLNGQNSNKDPPEQKANVLSAHNEASPEIKSHCVGKKRNSLRDVNASLGPPAPVDGKYQVEPMWSIDPALALSMYETQSCSPEEGKQVEPVDTDCTFISHSLLQHQGEGGQDRGGSVSGPCEEADDSLDEMFDTTAHGEYKSYITSHSGQTQPLHHDHGDDVDDDDDDDEEEEDEDDHNPPGNTQAQSKGKKAGSPTFAHVAVVRKKDERRKLKGSTCKECEIYYAHLPEEEREKKLSACSRHRFRYIPPCTPENFWEVGFPSTQTCIERGYIKEEKNPQARLRRRQPFTALFSQKRKEQET